MMEVFNCPPEDLDVFHAFVAPCLTTFCPLGEPSPFVLSSLIRGTARAVLRISFGTR